MGATDTLKALIWGSLMFSIFVTSYAAILSSQINSTDISIYTVPANETDINSISRQIDEGLGNQTGVNFLDLAGLTLYSGNFFASFFLNFIFAVPKMIGIVLTAIAMFTNFDPTVERNLIALVTLIVSTVYILSIINFLLGVRSGNLGRDF